jgi:hypothetical protein
MTLQQPEELQFTVGAQRHEVRWTDGTSVILHPVFDNGVPCGHHRALKLPHDVTLIVDLVKLVPQIGRDMCVLPPKDFPGVVFFNLRLSFNTAQAFVRRAIEIGSRLKVETREAA